MPSVTTPSGRKLDIEQLSAAAKAVEQVATNNSLMFKHSLGTCEEDVLALVELARMKWFEMERKR